MNTKDTGLYEPIMGALDLLDTSLRQVARRSGVSWNTIYKWGQGREPSLSNLKQIADAYGYWGRKLIGSAVRIWLTTPAPRAPRKLEPRGRALASHANWRVVDNLAADAEVERDGQLVEWIAPGWYANYDGTYRLVLDGGPQEAAAYLAKREVVWIDEKSAGNDDEPTLGNPE